MSVMDGSGSSIGIIIFLIVLTSLSAFFSACETAFSCANKVRLKSLANAGNKRAEHALALGKLRQAHFHHSDRK